MSGNSTDGPEEELPQGGPVLQDSLAHLRPSRIGPNPLADLSGSSSSSGAGTDVLLDRSADGFENLVEVYKYVDDTTVVETIDITNSKRHLTTNTPKSMCRVGYSELLLDSIKSRAEEIGMRVNCGKTQLLLISPPNGFNNEANIQTEEGRIVSDNSMKLLGFVFGSEPNANQHMKEIQRKFRARFWAMIHLRRSGFKGGELFELYSIFIRPVIEFCGVVYHSLITSAQAAALERMQKQIVKLAFGWDTPYLEICAQHGIESLEERRKRSIDKFVQKTLVNPRFTATWYPVRDYAGPNVRGRRIYHETVSRTSRYYNAPLSYMCRRANDMLTA